MSAIAGIWYREGRPAGESLARMLAALRPFGPDPAGQWVDDNVGIGRRLIATLPEDRHDRQPLVSRDGNMRLVADIRLDDRAGLTRKLAIDAPDAARMSDAALLLRAIERWGEASLGHVYGDYAFALWDAARQRWLLARDALGGRPLHYFHGPGCFAFASMPRGLHALPEIPYEVDDRVLAHGLELIQPEPGATCFRHIAKVPQGHLVIVDRDGVRVRRHWNPAPEPLRLGSAAAYQEAFRAELDLAVGNALRGAGDAVAAHLSAGLDSSAVAATAAQLLAPRGQRVVAFTAVPRAEFDGVGPTGRLLDEGAVAAEVATMHGNVEHVLVRTPGRSPFDALDRTFHLYEQPMLNLCNGVWIDAILDQARSRGLRVLLTGHMGNFTLSYRGHGVINGLVRQGRLIRAVRELLALRRREDAGPRRMVGELLGPDLGWRLRGQKPGHGMLRTDRREGLAATGHRIGAPLAERGLARRLALLHFTDQANRRKGTLAHWGIDERDPTADRRFAEFCLSLPEDAHLADGVSAPLVRFGLADRLPAAVREHRQRGLQASDWHMGLDAAALAEQVDRLARAPGVAALIDMPRLEQWARAWDDADWSDRATGHRYRHQMLRAVSFGHFLARAERANG